MGDARILIVEDNPDTRKLLQHILQKHYDVTVAPGINEALALVRDTSAYDLFLLDINLGEQRTGLDLLRLLRAEVAYAKAPALAITAYAMPGDEERCLSSGFNGYLSKPFTRKALLTKVTSVLSNRSYD
jgi:CheY-like chemotaxis protein